MKIAVGSDERTHLTDAVVEELHRRGHQADLFGPLAGHPLQWANVAHQVSQQVAAGESHQGILFCWTGTGVSIAANKVPGVRAALCRDAETARGARLWNDANVLCLSLRSTAEAEAKEILDAWLGATFDESERPNVEKVEQAHRQRFRSGTDRASR
ncbi:MAG: RpiB/LacA/LacB family sugar-phosphate isomerase [Dehalococcoidia bacterium]